MDPDVLIFEEENDEFFTERFPELISLNSMKPEVALVNDREIRMKHLIKERYTVLRAKTELLNKVST